MGRADGYLLPMHDHVPAPSAARGLGYDDLEPGAVFRSGRRTVTEADVVGFAGLSGDFNPLHVDAHAAERSPFRGRVAHGLLVQSIASGLAMQTGIFDGSIVALQEMVLRFVAPVRLGDTISIELEVEDKEAEPGPRRGWVRFAARVRNHDDVLVVDGEWLTLLHRRVARSPADRRAEERR